MVSEMNATYVEVNERMTPRQARSDQSHQTGGNSSDGLAPFQIATARGAMKMTAATRVVVAKTSVATGFLASPTELCVVIERSPRC